jgi:hypothetical protein
LGGNKQKKQVRIHIAFCINAVNIWKAELEDNIRLIKHLKYLCENDEIKDVTNTLISKWDFIYDHKDELKNPSQIYFHEPDDENWNNPQNELSFLHEKI